jgi:hypothetical protein
MATLLIKAENLSVGDILALPFNRIAEVLALKPVGPRSRFVNFKTENGWGRVEVGREVSVVVAPTISLDDDIEAAYQADEQERGEHLIQILGVLDALKELGYFFALDHNEVAEKVLANLEGYAAEGSEQYRAATDHRGRP